MNEIWQWFLNLNEAQQWILIMYANVLALTIISAVRLFYRWYVTEPLASEYTP